jgi:hypothetical protein
MGDKLFELQLQGDSTVYKVNDARITTTAVTTATHILTTNSGVTSIAPITAANLASVLGDVFGVKYGVIPADTDVQITLGTGLLVCTMLSSGAYFWLNYWEQPERMITASTQSITKVGETGNTYTIRSNQADSYYFFIGASHY